MIWRNTMRIHITKVGKTQGKSTYSFHGLSLLCVASCVLCAPLFFLCVGGLLRIGSVAWSPNTEPSRLSLVSVRHSPTGSLSLRNERISSTQNWKTLRSGGGNRFGTDN